MVSALDFPVTDPEFDSRWKSVFPALSSSLLPESSNNNFSKFNSVYQFAIEATLSLSLPHRREWKLLWHNKQL